MIRCIIHVISSVADAGFECGDSCITNSKHKSANLFGSLKTLLPVGVRAKSLTGGQPFFKTKMLFLVKNIIFFSFCKLNLYIYIYIYIYIYMYMYVLKDVYMCARACVYVHMYAHTNTYTHTHSYTRTYTNTLSLTHTHTHTHIGIYTYTYVTWLPFIDIL